jgi:phenylacetate-CoA ligase
MRMRPAVLTYELATRLSGEGAWRELLRDLQRLERAGPDAVREAQARRLARLLTFAPTVEQYRDAPWTGPVPPDEARERLRALPLLEKRVLQEAPERLHGDLESSTTVKSTGGSTGEPVRLRKTSEGLAMERAATWLGLGWSGIRVGDRSVRFWGTPLTRSRRLRFRLADLAMNRIRISAFDLQASDLEGYYRRIARFQPRWFYGYATLIDLLAEWIEGNGRDGTRLGLRSIVPTSEPLAPEQRERIRRVYGAPVQNEYGCGEVGAMAYECEAGQLHVMTESVLVEVLREDGSAAAPGETGEVVVTDLNNYAMPLIRYRLGDRAVRGDDCACGRPYPTLRQVVGRIHDVVYTPAGNRWHGEKIDYLMSSIHQELFPFRRYQVVQREPDLLEVRLVARTEVPDAVRRRIGEYVRDRLDGMRVEVVRVESIERSPSGKLRLVRNDVSPPKTGEPP